MPKNDTGTETLPVLSEAKTFKIVDPESLQLAVDRAKVCKGFVGEVEKTFEDEKKKADDLHKSLVKKVKEKSAIFVGANNAYRSLIEAHCKVNKDAKAKGLSIRPNKKVVITDKMEILKLAARGKLVDSVVDVNKKTIQALLEAGMEIPGATLDDEEIIITIR